MMTKLALRSVALVACLLVAGCGGQGDRARSGDDDMDRNMTTRADAMENAANDRADAMADNMMADADDADEAGNASAPNDADDGKADDDKADAPDR